MSFATLCRGQKRGRRGGWVGVEEFVEVCMVAEELDALRAACCCCSCCCCSCCDWVGVGIVGLASSASWLFAGVREVMEPRWECIEEWRESTADAQCEFVGEGGAG